MAKSPPEGRRAASRRWPTGGAPAAFLLRGWLLALAFASNVAVAAPAAGPGPGEDRAVRVEPLSGARAGSRDGELVLLGDAPARARLHLRIPGSEAGEGTWILRFERDSLTRLHVRSEGWAGGTRRFFAPEPSEGRLPSSFDFVLPPGWEGEREVLLEVDATGPYTLRPRLVREGQALAVDHRAIALYGAMYACLGLLALIAVSLLTATRDRAYLALLVLLGSGMLLLAAVNGHLYAVPWLQGYGLWDARGIWALILATGAAGIWLAQLYVQLDRHAPRLHRVLGVLAVGLLALAAVCLLNLPGHSTLLRTTATVAWLLAAAGGLAAVGIAVKRGVWMALPLFLVLLLLALAGVAFEAMIRGWLAGGFWVRHGYQVALVAVAVTLAIGLIGRITEFRAARERDRLARSDSERRLERESARADLIQNLQGKLRDLPPGDMEWAAFRALFDQLVPLLRLDAGALIAYGYHGFDLLLAEPLRSKEHFAALLSNRIGMMKGLARTRAPLQLPLEEPDPGITGTGAGSGGHALAGVPGNGHGGQPPARLHAVVPLPIRGPGWGLLLLERTGEEGFTHDELMLASDLGRLTVQHADEAATALNLRRSAELDALTGTLNRRTIDLWLARSFTVAFRGAQPLAVLFVDIDHFKAINDTFGHACGDECLRRVSEALRRELGPNDLLGRYGGEEFIVVLPGRNGDAARQVGERMRAGIEREEIECDARQVRLTVSIGVATRLDREDAPAATVERADKALYAAKRAGRNRVNVAPAVFH